MSDGQETHTVKRFDKELQELSREVLSFGALVTQQLDDAVRALLSRDAGLASQVLEREARVNQMDSDIEDAAVRLVATRSPKGRDLRAVFGMLKSGTDLERIGDEAKKVAKFAKRLAGSGATGSDPLGPAIQAMAAQASDMLGELWKAIDKADLDGAVRAAERDRALDREYSAALDEVHHLLQAGPEQARELAETLLTLKSIERIGDHAKNVARHYVFYARGDNVSHVKARNLRRAAGLPEGDSSDRDEFTAR
jgi:phosphate transport system protein